MISHYVSFTRGGRFALVLVAWIILIGGKIKAQAEEIPAGSRAELNTPEVLRDGLRKLIDAAQEKVFPALVNIEVVMVNYWEGRDHKGRAVGSGTIISPEGYVLTNNHVVLHGQKFKCTLADKQEIPAELVGEDPLTDLAVLKLDISKLQDRNKPLPIGPFGNSDELKVGDYVLAMGSPFALSRSVTLGIVSNTERVFTSGFGRNDPDEEELTQGQRTGLFNRWIQHDALINPGNSGGPLVNLKGDIVGVNSRGGASMGFAIPGNIARGVAETIIKNKEVVRSYFGISLRPIQDTGLKQGVLVNSVDEEGPAHKAGLEAGDVILKVDGEAVTVRFPEEAPLLMKRMADYPVGSQVKLSYEREGAAKEITVATEKLQKDRGDEKAFRGWGMTALEITDRMARDWRFENKEGAFVSGVRPGAPAQLAEPPIGENDVIRSINGQPVKSLADFIAQYDKIMDTKPLPETVLIGLDRRGKNLVTIIKPKPEKDTDQPREVAKAWIGIATQPVLKNLGEKLGGSNLLGFRVTRIYPGTEAAKSDLKVGDVITGLEGKPMAPKGMQDTGLLERAVKKMEIGEPATLNVARGTDKIEVKVPLERTKLTPEEAHRDHNRDFEITVRETTFFDRDEYRWRDEEQGVLVEEVGRAGWADLGGIRAYDLVQKIGRFEIKDIESYRQAMDKIAEQQPERVVMVVLRNSRTFYQFLEPDWKPVAKTDDKKEDKKKENPSNGP